MSDTMPKPSPEEKVAHCLLCYLSKYHRFETDDVLILPNVGGSVTEEGKRSVSYLGRSAKGQVRLPSSVTSPLSLLLVMCLLYFRTP